MKALFFDIDGTLVNDKIEMTARTAKALNKAAMAGHTIVLCSGRSVDGLKVILDDLDFAPCLATLNGAYIVDEEGKPIFSEVIDAKEALEVCSLIKECGLDYMYFPGPRWGTEGDNELYRFEFKVTLARGLKTPIEKIVKRMEINKLLSYGKRSAEFIDLASKKFPNLSFLPSSSTYTEINTKGASKGGAIIKVAEAKNIAIKDTICFGDYENDLSMFRIAGTKVAMGNAIAEIKAEADYITRTNNEDGVAVFLEEYLF